MCSVRSSPDGSASSSRCSLGGRICSAPGSPSRSRSQRAISSARWPSERPTLKSLVRKTSEAGGDGHSAQRHAVPSRSLLQNRQQKRGVMTVGGAPTCTLKWKFRNAPCSCSLPHLGGPTLTGPAGVIRTCSCGGGGTCALAGRTDSAALSASKTTNLRKVVRNCTIVQFRAVRRCPRAASDQSPLPSSRPSQGVDRSRSCRSS